jgi:hypothetical protein
MHPTGLGGGLHPDIAIVVNVIGTAAAMGYHVGSRRDPKSAPAFSFVPRLVGLAPRRQGC